MSNFEIVDKRGANKVEEASDPEAAPVEVVAGDRNGWKPKSLAYLIQIFPIDSQPIVAGMAAAIRSDGLPVSATYLFEQVWSEGFRWEPKAKKRLDTFLGCDCKNHSPCFRHKHLMAEWIQEDRERLARAAVQPVPEVMEIMYRMQQARQAAAIEIPRG